MGEVIGWVATAVFAASYFVSETKLRLVQGSSAVLWVIYGLYIGALPVVTPRDGAVGVEVDLAGGGAGAGRQAGRDHLGLLHLGQFVVTTFVLDEVNDAVAHAAANGGQFKMTVLRPG